MYNHAMGDKRVRDVIADLPEREALGDRLTRRVGRRGWERPDFAVPDRLYRAYKLGDPWDPADDGPRGEIPLGPVSLRLGEKRREPAPHARPPQMKQPEANERPAVGQGGYWPRVPDAPKPKAPTPTPAAPTPAP